MSYGGPGAVARAELAREVVLKRLELMGVKMQDVRAELIGMDSLHGPRSRVEPWEVRLRVAARCEERSEAVRVGNEVETLYTNGPSGGGGASKSVRQVVAVARCCCRVTPSTRGSKHEAAYPGPFPHRG